MFVHGIIDSSDGWVMNGKDSMAFMFADAGYDVWMANMRGNKYSMRHQTLDPNEKEYWDEAYTPGMGKYDIPAFIDYATKYSNVEKITVLAHSFGTSSLFYGIATNTEYF